MTELEMDKINSCKHLNCELRNYKKPKGLSENTFWFSESTLICLDCGTHLLYVPEDVTCIKNILHPAEDICKHTIEMRTWSLCGFGSSTCLQCGKKFGPVSPETKLSITSDNVDIGKGKSSESKSRESKTMVEIKDSPKKTDLHIVGTVLRVEEPLYDYGDVKDNENSILTIPLLQFEGKRVEIIVKVIGDASDISYELDR